MNLYFGTSGYSYKEWKGNFYPGDLPENRMLNYYAGRFRTVEINISTTILKHCWNWLFSLCYSSQIFWSRLKRMGTI